MMFTLARGLTPFRRQWLASDIVAGVVLTTLLAPQGMAYAADQTATSLD